MSTEREYDPDTTGDYDENTLDGSEGLDADVISTDGEDLTVEPPETWKSAEDNHTLDEKLEAEIPDVGSPRAKDEDAPAEPHDAIDDLEDEPRVLGEA